MPASHESSVGAYSLIKLQDVLLGADVASFDFSGIPQNFASLLVIAQSRNSNAVTATTINLRFNGDSGSNYDWQYIQVNNATVTGAIGTAVAFIDGMMATGSSAAANRYGSSRIEIPNYASTVNQKNVLFHTHTHNAGTTDAFVRSGGGQWRSTSAITSITILPSTGNLVTGSRYTLYGVA